MDINVKNPIIYFPIIFICYFVAWLIELHTVGNIQDKITILNIDHQTASIAFIPHGVRVMSIILLGSRAFMPIYIISMFTGYYFLNIENTVALSTMTLVSLALTLWVLKINTNGMQLEKITIKNILYVATVASVISSLLNSIFKYFIEGNVDPFLNILVTHTIGDIIGAVICFYFLGLFYKLLQSRTSL